MQFKLNSYISFDGNAREAMEFYKAVFGGELKLSIFEDMRGAPEGIDSSKLHTQFLRPIMAADSTTGMRELIYRTNMSLSLRGGNEEELTVYYAQLA